MSWVMLDGRCMAWEEALIPASSRGVCHGDGCFETMRSYRGDIPMFDRHIERLMGGMRYLGLNIPSNFTSSFIRYQISELVSRNGLGDRDASVRLQVWRDGAPGYQPARESGVRSYIAITALKRQQESVRLTLSPVRNLPAATLDPRFKLSNGIPYIMASMQAVEQGYDDALMCDIDGHVSETPIANIFWKTGQTVHTPSDACDLLPGITRGLVKEMLKRRSDIELEQGRYKPSRLDEAECVWLCNSVREIVPVAGVDHRTFDARHPFLMDFKQQFSIDIRDYMQ